MIAMIKMIKDDQDKQDPDESIDGTGDEPLGTLRGKGIRRRVSCARDGWKGPVFEGGDQ